MNNREGGTPNPTPHADVLPPAALPPADAGRFEVVDLYRGLVMALMILATNSGPGLPPWMYHASANHLDYLTWVDLVWPVFLWVTGVSIPLAMTRRIERGDPAWRTAGHILWRGLCLVWVGCLIDAWSGTYRYDLMPVGADVFRLVGFCAVVGAFVRWDVSKHPAWSWQRIAFWAVRVTSFGWLIYATAIVRFGSQGGYLWTAQAGSQGPAWGLPGSVLASFGRAFLWAAPLWWLTRKSLEMRIALLALSLLAILHWPSGMVASIVPNELAKVSPFDRFGFIVLCGTLTGDLLLRWNRDGRDLRKWLAGLTVGLLLAALLADPGLRWKFQAGALRYGPLCAGVFTALFWFAWELHRLMPSLGLVAEKPFLALGTNTLLAYLIVKPIVAIQGLAGIKIRDLYLKDVGGWPGFIDPIVWLVVFTAIVVIANRKRLYLRI